MESMARPRASLAAVARAVFVSASTAVAIKNVGYDKLNFLDESDKKREGNIQSIYDRITVTSIGYYHELDRIKLRKRTEQKYC